MPYTVPSNIPVIGGRSFPLPGDSSQPSQAPAAEDTSTRDSLVQQLSDENGGVLGPAAPVNLDKPDASGNQWAGYHRYTFKNGTTLDIMPNGTIVDYKPSTQANAAANATQRVHQDVTDKTTGNVYTWNPDKQNADGSKGGYDPAPGVPQAQRPQDGQTRQAVESGRNVTQTYDATSNSWRTTSVGDNAVPGTPVEGNTRTGVDAQGRKITQTYSDGSWIQTDIQGVPKDGATRTGVDAQGRPITQTYTDGSWMTTSMGGVPQNGDTRTAVDNQGRQITQTYNNGAWIQTAISGIPQNGQTRQTINASGQPVTQTYSDGTWINTAMPGAAREGDTRENIQGTRKVQQTFQNGSWQTTGDLGPSTPQPPTVLNTGTGATYTSYDPNTGKVTTQPNPNAADPGAQTILLQQQARAQHDQLNQQVANGSLSPDAAATQFNNWWNENIEPIKGDIATAQAKAQSALQYQQAQTAYEQFLPGYDTAQLAQTASNNAQSRFVSMMPYLVNASAATNPGVISNGPGKFPTVNAQQIMQNATYSLPNLQEIGRQGAAAALAHISPTAQMHLQTPGPLGQPAVPGGFDINSLLNAGAYNTFSGPGGAQPMPYTAADAASAGPPQPMPYAGGGGQPINLGSFSGQMPSQMAPIPATYGPLSSSNWWGNYQPAS